MKRVFIGSTAILSGLAGVAAAQETPFELPPIILESGFRDARDIRDAHVAGSVVQGEELERRQADTFEELIGDIPGVTIEGGPRGISQEPNIRGFQDEQVVLRVDGGRLNFNQAHRGRFFFDPDIVQRVEVVRGGGSTLFGSGVIGGVISVETKDPADLLKAGRTTGARFRFGGASNGNLTSGTATVFGDWGAFDVLAFVGSRSMGSPLEDGDGNDILRSEIDADNLLLKFGFEPTADQRFELSLSYYEDEGITPPNANDEARLIGTPSNPANPVERSAEIFTTRLSWDYNPEGSDALDLSVLFYGNLLDISEDRISDGRRDDTEYDTYGFEIVNRSRFEVGIPVSLVYGFEAYRDTQTGTRDGADRIQFPDAEADTLGVFAEATFGVTETLDIIAGARFDSYERDVDDPSLADADDTFFSPRVGFSYRPNDNWQFFGNLAQAYRAPTLTELYNDGEHFVVDLNPGLRGVNNFVPTPDLREEESIQVELGTRFETSGFARPGDRLSFAANAYYAEVDNFIDTVVTNFVFPPGPPPATVFGTTFQRNVDAELWGIEAELDYDAGAWFAGLGLTLPRGQQTNGDPLGSIPQDRLTATLGLRPHSDWEIGLRATFASGQSDVPTYSVAGEAYQLLDAFASWRPSAGAMDGIVLRAGIDNILNEQYTIFPNELPQPGRTIKVSATYTF